MNIPNDFVHKMFFAENWKTLVKDYISDLEHDGSTTWYRNKAHKKIREELTTLGYYVKYRFCQNIFVSIQRIFKSIQFYPERVTYDSPGLALGYPGYWKPTK